MTLQVGRIRGILCKSQVVPTKVYNIQNWLGKQRGSHQSSFLLPFFVNLLSFLHVDKTSLLYNILVMEGKEYSICSGSPLRFYVTWHLLTLLLVQKGSATELCRRLFYPCEKSSLCPLQGELGFLCDSFLLFHGLRLEHSEAKMCVCHRQPGLRSWTHLSMNWHAYGVTF